MLSRASQLPAPFTDLLSAEAVDELVTGRGLRLPSFRMVRDGETLPASAVTRAVMSGDRRLNDMADPDRIREHFTDGATLVLQSLHRSHPPLVRFCRELADELGHPTQCNAYVTPLGSQGFAAHHDTHDVFVLQVDGCKRWNIYPPVHALPLADQAGVGRDADGRLVADDPTPLLSVELQPGDALYLPRGYVHAAETADDRSIHLTIGVLVHRWHDLLRDLVTLAGEDLAFRRALPLSVTGTGHEDPEARLDLAAFLRRTADWVEGADRDGLAALVRKRLGRGRPAEPLGPLAAQRLLAEFDAGTRVRLRSGVSWTLQADADQDRVVLRLPDRELSLPRATETALRLALSGAPMSASELCTLTAASSSPEASLDLAGAVVLLRRLLREGALIPLAGP
jgi:lysine-specific demethylase/histidyl-hydroxylase NO66